MFAAITGFAYPLQRKLMNDAIPAHAPRATLLSVESIIDRAVCALAAVAAGAYLSAGRLDALLWHSALVTLAVMIALQLVLRKGSSGPGHRPDGPPEPALPEAGDQLAGVPGSGVPARRPIEDRAAGGGQ